MDFKLAVLWPCVGFDIILTYYVWRLLHRSAVKEQVNNGPKLDVSLNVGLWFSVHDQGICWNGRSEDKQGDFIHIG